MPPLLDPAITKDSPFVASKDSAALSNFNFNLSETLPVVSPPTLP